MLNPVTKKQFEDKTLFLLLGIFPLFYRKKPVIRNNTFIVWEPCSKSHAEVVPGYVKYLLDMGYHVSVLVTPDRYKEGLFSKFTSNKNLSLNYMSQKAVKKYFKKSDLSEVRGLLITTAGKLCDSIHYDDVYSYFAPNVDKTKIYMVEHEVKGAIDAGTWRNSIITLRKLDYKKQDSVVVNPNYFGDKVSENPNKNFITNFITIGAIRAKRNNANMIVDAVKKLHNEGIHNFKITVVGKGHIQDLPKEIHKYFDIKGRLPFDKMYKEIENADFILTSYDAENEKHQRYITTGTSGTFQLVYGFNKPCIITEKFAPINGFNTENAILYTSPSSYSEALKQGININNSEYLSMKNKLENLTNLISEQSLKNLRGLIND